MTDFIIVGRGLAASALMHAFSAKNISFEVVGKETLSNCSRVAAGIWNPIVFKRLTKSWMASELISYLKVFYSDCEQRTGIEFTTNRTIIRPFSEEQEIQLWRKKAANELDEFLDPVIYDADQAPEGSLIKTRFGKVNGAGNLNVHAFLQASGNYFKHQIHDTEFLYKDLQIFDSYVRYGNIQARNILFCEGYLVKNNLFFKWIPLKPAKGEILDVDISGLELKGAILNKSAFLMQVEKNIYKVGATYDWDHLDDQPTNAARSELETKLSAMVPVFKTIKAGAGVRPSSLDRRPIIGPHPVHSQLFVFNGLGTKGVMLAPYFVRNFVNFYLQSEPIDQAVSIKRFYHLYEEKK